LLRALAVLALLLGSASAIEAQTVVTLAWDANTEPDLAGYEVSYGTQSGVYSTTVDVGNVTSRAFTLTSGVVYYFAVKAYNSASPRLYSPYSTEVSTGVATNRAPTLVQPASQTAAEHASVSLQLVASDPDLNPLTFSATGLPASLTINATTGLISGTLTYTSAGSYTVTATVSDGALTNSRTFAWTVTDVAKPTPVVTWANPATITYGTALSGTQLNATASVAGTFAYSPATGTVLSAGEQILLVTFTPTDTANYTTATRTATITVARATPVVTWATPASVVAGTALGATQLNATASVAGTFVYTPASGTVLAAGTQTLSATFTPTDTASYTTATRTVTLTVTALVKTTPVITWANPAAITYGTALSVTQLNATANVAGTFAYTPASGTVLTAGTQTLSATFTPTDTANYTTATRTVTLTVARATPIITWANPASITYGTALSATQLNATANVAGTFAYTPASGTVLTAGAQALSVTFTPTDTANYATATRTVTLTVTAVAKTTPVITWSNPASITYGTALGATQLNATASVAGTFVYTPASGTLLTAGANQTLSVLFTPTDTTNYTTATKTVTLTVAKASTTIKWSKPGRIGHGKPLGSTELNATADVVTTAPDGLQLDPRTSITGTFVYTPPAGTVLPVGTSTLSVTFMPADSVNYSAATGTTTIDVLSEPALSLAPATLRFAGTNTSGTLGPITAPQTATVTFDAASVAAWSASANQPWVKITNGSGLGSGSFAVEIINPANVLGTATSASATITVTAPGASNSPQALAVLLTLQPASANQAPFGAFDTPVSGVTGLQGSFAVTGWALDDVGIDRVEIWRDRVPGETTPVYSGSGPGNGKIFIANPPFMAGSRTDVEAVYPSYPFANRAGWGYLLLSQGLWAQGNGTYTLYAFAVDEAGRSATLGTKSITVSNATATRPFGALDTPAENVTVSGGFWSYGWALTPTGTQGCTIANGSVLVGIDSGPLLPVNYGDRRADIAAAFPGLSNGNNAGGAHYIDTTTLSNGIHQIGWLVTDNCGRQDGIGSRFFTVLNGIAGDSVVSRRPSATAEALPAAEAPPAAGRPSGTADVDADIPQVAGTAIPPETSTQPAIPGVVAVRQLGGDWQVGQPEPDGWHIVEVSQGGRVEVQLPVVAADRYRGFQDAMGQRRRLPVGSSLDTKAGIFYWQPAPAFLGSFDLVFEAPGEGAARVRVVVK
jgi:hypothetical protein